jgi:hypothetical protein
MLATRRSGACARAVDACADVPWPGMETAIEVEGLLKEYRRIRTHDVN